MLSTCRPDLLFGPEASPNRAIMARPPPKWWWQWWRKWWSNGGGNGSCGDGGGGSIVEFLVVVALVVVVVVAIPDTPAAQKELTCTNNHMIHYGHGPTVELTA